MEGERNEETEQRKVVDYSPTKSCRALTLFLIDNIMGGLIIGPLTVMYWRGSFALIDLYLFPNDVVIRGWTCSAVANAGILCLVYLQKPLTRWLRLDHPIHWIFGYHLYTYVLGGLNVCQWKGLWLLLDYYTGVSSVSAWTTFAVGKSFCCTEVQTLIQ